MVFAGPLFSFRFNPWDWWLSAIALSAFCLISSAIYLLNDCLDVDADRSHPTKCRRPIASGLVPIPTALATSCLLALASVGLSWRVNPSLAAIVVLYGVIQVAYCLTLKQIGRAHV